MKDLSWTMLQKWCIVQHEMVKEYNNLADKYNKLVEDKEALERKNRDRAYEVINQQERSR